MNSNQKSEQWIEGYRSAIRKVEWWRDCHKARGRSMGMNSHIECEIRDVTELADDMRRYLLQFRANPGNSAEKTQQIG